MKAEIFIAVNLPIQTIRHIKLVTGLMPQILRRKVHSTIPLYNKGWICFSLTNRAMWGASAYFPRYDRHQKSDGGLLSGEYGFI